MIGIGADSTWRARRALARAVGDLPAGQCTRVAAFQKLVAAGDIHYFVAGGGMGGGLGGGLGSSVIAQWVEANFPATTIGGVTVYNLG